MNTLFVACTFFMTVKRPEEHHTNKIKSKNLNYNNNNAKIILNLFVRLHCKKLFRRQLKLAFSLVGFISRYSIIFAIQAGKFIKFLFFVKKSCDWMDINLVPRSHVYVLAHGFMRIDQKL